MNIRRPKMFEDASVGRVNKLILHVLIFFAVFLVISLAQSIVPSIVTSVEMVKAMSAYTMEEISSFTYEQTMEISMAIAGLPSVMLASLYATVISTILTVIFCRFIEKRPLSSIGMVKKNCVRDYLVGMLVGLVMFSAVIGVNLLFGAMTFDGLNSSVNVGMLLLYFGGYFFQGMSEEFLCRGYLMNSIGGKHHMAWAVGISSVVFGLLHSFNNGISVLAMVNLILVGLFLAVYMICFDNIWGACAIHSVWNFVQGNIYGVSVSGMPLSETLFFTSNTDTGALMNGGSFGAEGGLGCTIVMVLSLAALVGYMVATGRITFGKKPVETT